MAISDKNNDKKGQAYVVQGNGVIIGQKKAAAQSRLHYLSWFPEFPNHVMPEGKPC
jgi:uncharacterized protein affecting Mg2+/Co2+ transport